MKSLPVTKISTTNWHPLASKVPECDVVQNMSYKQHYSLPAPPELTLYDKEPVFFLSNIEPKAPNGKHCTFRSSPD